MVSLQDLFMLFGGATAVVSAVIIFVANRVTDKLNISWKKQADAEIARLQGDIDKSTNTITQLLSIHGTSYGQAQERRIKAIEILWAKLIEFEEVVPPPFHVIFNVLTEEEMKNFWTLKTDNALYNTYRLGLQNHDFNQKITDYRKTLDAVKLERPFLGEHIWNFAELYIVFIGRIAYAGQEGTKRKTYVHWHHDSILKDLFKKTLEESEYEYVYSNKMESLKRTETLLENKLIAEIDKVLSGTHTTESALDRLKKFESVLNTTNRPTTLITS